MLVAVEQLNPNEDDLVFDELVAFELDEILEDAEPEDEDDMPNPAHEGAVPGINIEKFA